MDFDRLSSLTLYVILFGYSFARELSLNDVYNEDEKPKLWYNTLKKQKNNILIFFSLQALDN